MFFTIRLLKRSDLDLITLYRGGINIRAIFKEALYHYARNEDFRVAVEPVPPIPLDKACDHVVTKPGYRTGTEVKRYVPIRIDCSITDPASVRVLSATRSAYGSTFSKFLIRMAIVNMPLSPLLLYGSEARRAALTSSARKRSGTDAEKYLNDIESTVSRISGEEQKQYEELLLLKDPALYIATSDKKLRASSAPAKKASASAVEVPEPVPSPAPAADNEELFDKPSVVKSWKDEKDKAVENEEDGIELLFRLGQQASS